VFGISFTELLVVVVVGLIVLGPQKLPGLFRTIGQWVNQLRRLTTEVRVQSGIDEILRSEGLSGGLSELRGMVRADFRRGPAATSETTSASSEHDPYACSFDYDTAKERPVEGPDSYDALAEDLTPTTLNLPLTK